MLAAFLASTAAVVHAVHFSDDPDLVRHAGAVRRNSLARRGFVLSGAYVLAMARTYAALRGSPPPGRGRIFRSHCRRRSHWASSVLCSWCSRSRCSGFTIFSFRRGGQTACLARCPAREARSAAQRCSASVLALIVGPCVTPPLAAALLYVAQTGDLARGAAALFALGLGMVCRRWPSARSEPACCRVGSMACAHQACLRICLHRHGGLDALPRYA